MKDVATIQPLHALEVGAEHAFQIELDGKGNKGEAGAKLQLFAPDHVSTVSSNCCAWSSSFILFLVTSSSHLLGLAHGTREGVLS